MAKRRFGRRSTRRGTISIDIIKAGLGAASGFTAANYSLRFAPAALQTGTGRAIVKVGIGVLGAMLLKRFAGRSAAVAFGGGAVANAALDLFAAQAPSASAAVHGYSDFAPMLPAGMDPMDAARMNGYVTMAPANA